MRCSRKMEGYLNHSATGEVRRLSQQALDLPRRAESKVAFHLLDRHADPSSEEGKENPVLHVRQFEFKPLDRSAAAHRAANVKRRGASPIPVAAVPAGQSPPAVRPG